MGDTSMSRSLRKLRTWWLTVPEPREISVAYTVIYALAATLGVATIAAPPDAIQHIASTGLIILVGCFLTAGAALAAGAGYWDYWQLERLGLVLICGGLVCYGILVGALQHTTIGSRIGYLIVIVLAIMSMLLRWLMIRGFTYRPRG